MTPWICAWISVQAPVNLYGISTVTHASGLLFLQHWRCLKEGQWAIFLIFSVMTAISLTRLIKMLMWHEGLQLLVLLLYYDELPCHTIWGVKFRVYSWTKKRGIHIFLKCICEPWNANSLVQVLNFARCVQVLTTTADTSTCCHTIKYRILNQI